MLSHTFEVIYHFSENDLIYETVPFKNVHLSYVKKDETKLYLKNHKRNQSNIFKKDTCFLNFVLLEILVNSVYQQIFDSSYILHI